MRCFFAAWPDSATQSALGAVMHDVSRRVEHRRVTRADDLHLTLTFIGELADEDAVAMARAAEALKFEPFEWQIDLLGIFSPAGVVWAGTDPESEANRPLVELAAALRRRLVEARIVFDDRPLAPHVTLLHGVKRFTCERIAPIVWRIDSVGLYRSTRSRTGARYQRVVD